PTPNTCGFNFNMVSAGPKDNTNKYFSKQLALLYHVLASATKTPESALALFKKVTEFKFWDNRLRVSLANSEIDAVATTAQVGKVIEESERRRLVALVGDAVRDALPNSGMGVNDGHHMAQALGTVIGSVVHTDATPRTATGTTAKLAAYQAAVG